MGNFLNCKLALERLLLVFLMLAPSSIYTKSMVLYLSLLDHWKTNFSRVAEIWENNLLAFIEEDGELSFSVLSRTVLADSTKSSFKTLNKAYSGQYLYRQAMEDLQEDLESFSRTTSLHIILTEEAEEVKQLAKFLELHFKSLQQDTLEIYPALKKGIIYYEDPVASTKEECTILLNTATLEKDPSLDLSIPLFEPPSMQHCLNEILNTIENALLDNNFSGCEIKYILHPEDLESVSTSSSDSDVEMFPD